MIVTNVLGIAFTATVLSASDAGAVFVFPEDGATNTIAWTSLSPSSRDSVCDAADFMPIPPALSATCRMASNECRRIRGLVSDKRLEVSAAAGRMAAVRDAFAVRCREKGLTQKQIDRLAKRLDFDIIGP